MLVLLIVSVGVHFALTGLGLWFFGAEGSRTPAFSSESFSVGGVNVSVQSLLVVLTSVAADRRALPLLRPHALRQGAARDGAEPRRRTARRRFAPDLAGALTFTLAALLCAFSGVLIGPITTVYYDSGFLVSLKGFVGAIIGGLVSYPLAAAGALLVGLLESFASFWASGFKEVIVFTLIIPVLLWRSLTTHHHEEEDE